MCRCILFAVIVGLLSHSSFAQDVNHYVVVGAFGVRANAARLASLAGKSNLKARVDLNAEKKLYYVYLIESGNKSEAYAYVMKVRVETPFKDAWVYHGTLGDRPIVKNTLPPPIVKEEVKEEVVTPVISEPEKAVVVAAVITEPPPVVKEDPVPAKPPGKAFFFKLVNEATGNPVQGEIQVMETVKATEYIAYESNQIVYLPAPKNPAGTYQLKTLAPGYKPSKRGLSYSDPANSAASRGSQDEFVIAIPLVRVKTGDYIEFNHVKFITNSTILQPESQNELRGLATLMKDNKSYKVVVHGHCNGNEDRDVIALGSSTELFASTSGNTREHMDAKQFTVMRAETVKNFLVQEGVEESRIQTKGEGGKQYIYPPNSSLSARNDRVEVEVKKGR